MNLYYRIIPLIITFVMYAPMTGWAGANPNAPYCEHDPACWEPNDDPSTWYGTDCCRPKEDGTEAEVDGVAGRCCGGVWYAKDPAKEDSDCWEWNDSTCEYDQIHYQVSISAPSTGCAGESVDCSATTTPSGLENDLIWSSAGVPDNEIGASYSTVFTDKYGINQLITVQDPCSGIVYFHFIDICGPHNAGDPMPGPFTDSISLSQSLSFGPFDISLVVGGVDYGNITIPQIAGVNVSLMGSGSTEGDAHPITYAIKGTTSAQIGMPISITYGISADGTVERYEHVACHGPNCSLPVQHGSEVNSWFATFNVIFDIQVRLGIIYSTPPISVGSYSGSAPSEHSVCMGCISTP